MSVVLKLSDIQNQIINRFGTAIYIYQYTFSEHFLKLPPKQHKFCVLNMYYDFFPHQLPNKILIYTFLQLENFKSVKGFLWPIM